MKYSDNVSEYFTVFGLNSRLFPAVGAWLYETRFSKSLVERRVQAARARQFAAQNQSIAALPQIRGASSPWGSTVPRCTHDAH